MLNDQAIGAYLERIGFSRPVTADQAGLRELHRAHQLAVPFENLSIHLSEPISLDENDLFSKVVTRRRGGFCYELNGAFALLIEALGGQVRRVGAKVYGEGGLGPPLDHMALVITAADGTGPWLADVGFGSHSIYPLRFDDRAEQADPAATFLLADTAEGDVQVIKDGAPEYLIEPRDRPPCFPPTAIISASAWRRCPRFHHSGSPKIAGSEHVDERNQRDYAEDGPGDLGARGHVTASCQVNPDEHDR